MTIQEALRSGKPFKRLEWNEWFVIGAFDFPYSLDIEDQPVGPGLIIAASDLLASDWVVREKYSGMALERRRLAFGNMGRGQNEHY